MPQRFLKPGITNSERWNSVSWEAQSLYIRLITRVDDYGRCDGRTSVVLGDTMSVWNDLHQESEVNLLQLSQMLQQLSDVGLIDVYATDGKKVIQITQWNERIRAGVKEKWPAKNAESTVLLGNNDACAKVAASSQEVAASSAEDSVNPPTPKEPTKPARKPCKPNLCDEEWLTAQQAMPSNQGINVRLQYDRMVNWCLVNHRQPTRRMFVNWLNRCDRPMRAGLATTEADHQGGF